MKKQTETLFSALFSTSPELTSCRDALEAVFETLIACFRGGNKLLVCGNGGSAADTEHIVGELMKGFRHSRPVSADQIEKLRSLYGTEGERIGSKLQGALPAISLVSQTSLATAVANDVSPDMVFAQQVFGYGSEADALIAISTSGNSVNVINAVKVARALNLRTIALTGPSGTLSEIAEFPIRVPGHDTARIQELHMAVYHTVCTALETALFPQQEI